MYVNEGGCCATVCCVIPALKCTAAATVTAATNTNTTDGVHTTPQAGEQQRHHQHHQPHHRTESNCNEYCIAIMSVVYYYENGMHAGYTMEQRKCWLRPCIKVSSNSSPKKLYKNTTCNSI